MRGPDRRTRGRDTTAQASARRNVKPARAAGADKRGHRTSDTDAAGRPQLQQPTIHAGSKERPFTVKHFRAWARRLELDNGNQWDTEPFQEAFLEDLFADIPECWLIVPEGNAKTTLLAGVGLYHIQHRRSAMVPIGASSRDQAEILYRQAEGFSVRPDSLLAVGYKLGGSWRDLAWSIAMVDGYCAP